LSDTTDKPEKKSAVFVREATGLVREAGLFDILQFNAQSVTGVAIVSGGLLLLPLMTSGNGIWESIVIGLLLAVFVNMTYYTLCVTIPRSGGDYVYVSRILHPFLGVLCAGLMGIFVPLILASTFGASVWVTAGLSPLLAALGSSDLAGAVTTPLALTGFGILSTIFFTALLIFGGVRAFFRLNNILYLIAIIGLIAGAAVFLTVSHSTYVQLFDNYAKSYGTNSSDIISTANANGLTTPGTGVTPVFIASALMFASFYWATQSTYLGGEIRSVKRTQFWGIIGAAIIWGAIALFAILAAYITVGSDLITAANYLDYLQPALWKIPVSSFFALYSNVAAQNPAISALISLAFLVGYLTATGWSFVIMSRVMFALSFDRFFPQGLADVSERRHTPVKALLLAGGITIVFLLLLTNSQTAVVLYTWGVAINVLAMLVFMLSSISLAVLPFRRKTLFDTSCPYKGRIGGIPSVTLLGAASVVLLILYEYLEITNPVFFGITPLALEAMSGAIVFFAVLYVVIRMYRNSKGVPLDAIYKEIPPE
jgi:amino acid transporter